ncbi:MAG: RNA 3'-terminal phosphate cyclase [Nitrososphaeria archaeon]|nr:RNA 3'-terminal phosphate cyclase [Nitrososphaeria archaeon]MDW8042953.1 RNA 3'-terminal phosphate cyclase [Nitrososphaerota archaeon]
MEPIVIDGSVGEGGGQILRMAVSAAALLSRPIRVVNVRAKRNPPGLRPQHLVAVRGVAELTGGRVEGLRVGSMEVAFYPSAPRSGRFVVDAGTAGSTTLMLQSLLPVTAFATGPVELELRGGTNNPMAPPVEYLNWVLMPALRRMGVRAEIELVRRGFYPRGGGIVRARVEPVRRLRPIDVETGRVVRAKVFAYSCNLPEHIVERMARRASEGLKRLKVPEVAVETEALQSPHPKCSLDPGTGVIVVLELDNGLAMGFDSLGERGVPAERVADRAVEECARQLRTGAPVDSHLGDQLVIWVALADGRSTYRVTELTGHTETAVFIAERVIGARFDVESLGDRGARITCDGIGFSR